jgi:hypothetical protein
MHDLDRAHYVLLIESLIANCKKYLYIFFLKQKKQKKKKKNNNKDQQGKGNVHRTRPPLH